MDIQEALVLNNDVNIKPFDKMVEYGIVSTVEDEKKIIRQINKYLRSKEIKNLRKETDKSMLEARYPFNYNYFYWQGTKRGSIGQGSIWHLELLANKDINGKMQFPEREDIAFFFLVIKHNVNLMSEETNDGRDKFFQGLIEAIDFPVEIVYNYVPYEERRNNEEYLEHLFRKDFE